MKSFLDNVAAIIGAATVALLVISVTHEYGYFWVVGSRLQTFVTASDYFSNAIVWLPWLVFILYFYVDWDVLMGRRKYGFGWNWATYLWFAFIFGLPILGLLLLDEIWIFGIIIPAILAWLAFFVGRLPYANTESETLKLTHRAMVITPIVIVLSFGWGITQGQSALKSFDEPYTIDMKSGEKIQRIMLRTFDKGLLVRDMTENRIEFIKWDDFTKLYRYAPPERKMPMVCIWFGVRCPTLVVAP